MNSKTVSSKLHSSNLQTSEGVQSDFRKSGVTKKAVVILSAGLDSSANLCLALEKGLEVTLALTFDYGQKAAVKETTAAANLCRHYGVSHRIVSLPWFRDFNRSSLLVEDQKIPTGDEVQIDDLKSSEDTKKSVWVPNRNGIFLNIAAAYAESLEAHYIIPGFNKEEAQTFPDNSEEFLQSINKSLAFSTDQRVQARCFTLSLDKTEIVKAVDGKLDFNLIWPCYQAQEKWCGECESCKRSLRAFKEAGVNVSHLVEKVV